jgi:hypothetical protein
MLPRWILRLPGLFLARLQLPDQSKNPEKAMRTSTGDGVAPDLQMESTACGWRIAPRETGPGEGHLSARTTSIAITR